MMVQIIPEKFSEGQKVAWVTKHEYFFLNYVPFATIKLPYIDTPTSFWLRWPMRWLCTNHTKIVLPPIGNNCQ
jgi:hypothetical protein